MRERILTDTEKQAVKDFLESGKSSNTLRMVRYRARKFLPSFKEDIELLNKLVEKS